MPIKLNQLWDRVYKAPHDIFAAAGKVAFMELYAKHYVKTEADKKYEYEKDNEPVYSGIDTFRAWMDGEISKKGPWDLVQGSVNSLINQNKNLRNRHDPNGAPNSWTPEMYLLKPTDDAAYQSDIEKKEFDLCSGNVSLHQGSYIENWGLIDIPAWITGSGAAGPDISDAEVTAIKAELQDLTKSEDEAWGKIATVTEGVADVGMRRQRVINWHGQYMAQPKRDENLADIWNKKKELHTLMRIRLQIQRLEVDNERLTSSGKTGGRVGPEEVEAKSSLELIDKGGLSVGEKSAS